MLTQEMVVTINVLKHQGQSVKAIARETGVARNTVKKYLHQTTTEPRYAPRPARLSKLDPFKPYIHDRIAAADPDWIPASVLFAEIVARGYPGKVRMVSAYVAALKPTTCSSEQLRLILWSVLKPQLGSRCRWILRSSGAGIRHSKPLSRR